MINKYETVGIFLSVAVMSIALVMIRVNVGDGFIANSSESPQGAVVVASQEKRSDAELESTLKNASTADGTLTKLVIEDVRKGDGATVRTGDTVVVQYIGTTQDGVRFDSSYERGEPFIFKVGTGTVIKGWDEGLLGMKVGGQRILVIPSEMAYGNRQVGTIPPNTPLVFAVELLEIR